MWKTVGLWRDWASGGQPAAFSPSLPSLFPLALSSSAVFLKGEGSGNSFKLFYFRFQWDLNMHTVVLIQSVLAPLLLILLSAVGDTLLQSVRWVFTKLFFSPLVYLFWDSVESNKKEGGSEFCWQEKLLERRMWKSFWECSLALRVCKFSFAAVPLFILQVKVCKSHPGCQFLNIVRHWSIKQALTHCITISTPFKDITTML